MKINWNALKLTPADNQVNISSASLGLEYRHNAATQMRVESVEVHDGQESIKVHRDPRLKSGWTKPYRTIWK